MKTTTRVGILLTLLWLAWTVYAFVTFQEMAVLLAWYTSIGGAVALAVYFGIVTLWNSSLPGRRLAKVLLLILAAMAVAAISRYFYIGYQETHRGQKIDFTGAPALQIGTTQDVTVENLIEGVDEEKFVLTPGKNGELTITFTFADPSDAEMTYVTLFDRTGRSVGTYQTTSSGTRFVFRHDVQEGQTYRLLLENVKAEGDTTLKIESDVTAN